MRPQALERLGLDAKTIRSQAADKIYCLITGYGTDGPYAGEPTYDSVVQAASGITGLTLARDGTPAYVPLLICDHIVGEIAAGAVMGAIMQRQSTGEGTTLEIPMFETMASFVMQEHLAQQSFDPPVGPAGDQRLLSPYNKPVETADGWISFTVNTNAQVVAFLRVTGRNHLIDDPRYNSVAARARNVREWFEIRGAALTQKTTAEWLSVFAAADIASKPCHTLETLRDDPHLNAVKLFVEDSHPTEGATIALRSPIRVDEGIMDLPSFAQPKGWETRQVLEDLGYDADTVEGLISDGAAIAAC
jgi:crotonobetainyl-CoA:carnitine CoA-transferase CaiB-like acyl-CoA transferase